MHIPPTLWYYLPVLLGIVTKSCTALSETPTPSSAPNPDWHMDLFIPNGIPEEKLEEIREEAEKDQTYLAAYSEDHTGLADPGSYETITQIAANHFRWLEANIDITKLYSGTEESEKRWLLVAVFYVPDERIYFASTVPRGIRWKEMEKSGRAKAPAWWHRASKKDTILKPAFHAEDSAYFGYESTVEFSYFEDIYPSGSFIAAFGARRSSDLQRYVDGPKPIPLCAGGSYNQGKRPSCREVAQSLGVGFGTRRAREVSVNDEDEDSGLTEEEWLLADCQKLPPRQKRNLAINGGHIIIGKRNITCPSPALLSLDYQNFPTPTFLSTPLATWWTASSHSISATMTITTPTPSTLSTSVMPSVSCYAHFEDPDAGDVNQYCVCNNSRTEAFLPSGSGYPCSYTTLPPRKRDNVRTVTPSDASIINTGQTMASSAMPVVTSITAY
ncbi:hypothetical protein NPX13_g8358 [Xylaria arbuscula]|uniref:Enterotoxin n=1 Tax=Xylaria arbuscula TaxID=114810 RepID=A0A9W8TJI1_9PEZI|nr:hypothetical protein NPX13_g8358 [Xylaria arbuscula]